MSQRKFTYSLIHANRLRLCRMDRVQYFSKYRHNTANATQGDTKSHDGDSALLEGTQSSQSAAAASTTATQVNTATDEAAAAANHNATKQQKRTVRIFRRSTDKTVDNSDAVSKTDLTAAADISVTGGSMPPTSSGRLSLDQPLSSTTSPLPLANKRTVSTPTQPVQDFSDWHDIKQILTHQRRGRKMFYRVQWPDNSISWLPEKDVSAMATDFY